MTGAIVFLIVLRIRKTQFDSQSCTGVLRLVQYGRSPKTALASTC